MQQHFPLMLSPQEFTSRIISAKIPKFRAVQALLAIYKQGAENYALIKQLPGELKDYMTANFPIYSIQRTAESKSTRGNVIKTLFTTGDNQKIESVLMSFKDGRNTVCVSSQVGCRLGCKFCATGKMGFIRDLEAEEIQDQVLYFQHLLHKKGQKVSNVVYMGMGEPFLNYDNVMSSIKDCLNHPDGIGLAARNITISTSGIPEGIRKLADEQIQVNLAVSLHAPNQQIREQIMPVAKMHNLNELLDSIELYISKTNRRVTYEYIMLEGINDSEKDALELAGLIKHQLCHINLIAYNATGIEGITGSPKAIVERFNTILNDSGIASTIRVSLGRDIDAACGQLANKSIQK